MQSHHVHNSRNLLINIEEYVVGLSSPSLTQPHLSLNACNPILLKKFFNTFVQNNSSPIMFKTDATPSSLKYILNKNHAAPLILKNCSNHASCLIFPQPNYPVQNLRNPILSKTHATSTCSKLTQPLDK